jgi:hypothetical protein
MKSFFKLQDLIFLTVCAIGAIVYAIINNGFEWKEAVYFGICILGVIVYRIENLLYEKFKK